MLTKTQYSRIVWTVDKTMTSKPASLLKCNRMKKTLNNSLHYIASTFGSGDL